MTEPIWKLTRGRGPLVATAIHDGHAVRDEVLAQMAIPEENRTREEDPFTGEWAGVAPTRVVGTRSRFEVDLNRDRGQAVYRTPEDAWGLQVWKDVLPEDVAQRSLAQYDAFYNMLDGLYSELAREHSAFVVFDLHTYNHRREGPDGPFADPIDNPQVNIGTETIGSPERFRPLVDRFIEDLAAYPFPGGRLDVRENIKFKGGHHARWAHEQFPESACVIAIEFKKFFMCEWFNEANDLLIGAITDALASTVPGVMQELASVTSREGIAV